MYTAAVARPALPFTVLVLGGAGFIGRHAAKALVRRGHRVVIGTRHPNRGDKRIDRDLKSCERREFHHERLLTPDKWLERLVDIDAVINCVGILRERFSETYDRVHHLAPAALAEVCARRGIRLLHVSALGLGDNRSRFITSKRRGESALLASEADVAIVRPSLLDGDGGFGARWLRRVADWPVHPLPANAKGLIAAMKVEDLGTCLARLALAPAGMFAPGRNRQVELGGPVATPLAGLLDQLRARPGPARRLPLPGALVRAVAHLCDALHLTPLSFGHYELLQRDNAPVRNDAARWLGRPPAHVGPLPPVAGTHGLPAKVSYFRSG